MKIFITGGTSGIGLALALLYLKRGEKVGLCGRDLSKVSELINTYPQLKTYQVDVLDREELLKAIADFGDGSLDMMIACAGRSHGKKTKTPDFEASRNIIEINTLGVLNTFEGALAQMLPRKKGHLVAIASVAGLVGLPGASAYSASKSAVIKLCESYQLDLKEWGIDVTTVCPGFVDTPLTRKNNHAMPFLMPVEEGARRIARALDQKKALFIFPWQMKFVITLLEKMPRSWYRCIMGMKIFNYSQE